MLEEKLAIVVDAIEAVRPRPCSLSLSVDTLVNPDDPDPRP